MRDKRRGELVKLGGGDAGSGRLPSRSNPSTGGALATVSGDLAGHEYPGPAGTQSRDPLPRAELVGVLVSEPEKVQIFAFTLVLPLTFTSNAFVATSTMPGWLQSWVEINPVTKLADGVRGLLTGGPVTSPALTAVLWAAAITALFAPLALRALSRRI